MSDFRNRPSTNVHCKAQQGGGLTLKGPGMRGGMCPQHFQRLVVLRAMKLGVSNVHKFLFSCLKEVAVMKIVIV